MLKKYDKVVFIIICAMLGIILSIQFKTVVKTLGKGVSPRQRINQLSIEYEKLQKEEEKLRNELADVEDEITKYEDIEKDKNSDIKRLYDKLEKYKKFVGYDDIVGSGVTIEIDDPPMEAKMGEDYSIIVANYDLILQLISKLNDLGAEAIAINGQRYTDNTSLEADVKSLKINDISITPPLKIDIIGDSERIQNGLKVKGNIMWYMQYKYLYSIKIREEKEVIIPKLTNIEKFKYAKPVE